MNSNNHTDCTNAKNGETVTAKVKSEYHYPENAGIPAMPGAEVLSGPVAAVVCLYSEAAKRYSMMSSDIEKGTAYMMFLESDGKYLLKAIRCEKGKEDIVESFNGEIGGKRFRRTEFSQWLS